MGLWLLVISLVRGNLLYENSKIQKFSAIYFKGNYNKFYYNIIQNNGFYGLHIKGDRNAVFRTPVFKNKNIQLIVEGNRNNLTYLDIEGGYKSGVLIKGSYNRLNNTQIDYNKENGIAILGNKNLIVKNSIQNNSIGVRVRGHLNYLEQNIIGSNMKYGIYHESGHNNRYNYNYIVNNKARYNLYRVSGFINADYNWWGKNNVKSVKNLNVKRYVIAVLKAPNILKVKKVYTVGVIFCSNTHKRLKKTIPNLIVYFEFKGGQLSPKYRIVTKHIVKVKIRSNKHKAINLLAQVDNQLLYKQYVSFRGKLYEYGLYKKIYAEMLRKWQEQMRKYYAKLRAAQARANAAAAAEAKKRSQLQNGYYNLIAAGNYIKISPYMNTERLTMPKKPVYAPPPATITPGVGYAKPGSDWVQGMKARNMPKGSFAKFLYDSAVKLNIKDSRIYYGLYLIGKVSDAFVYSNGNINKFFEYNFINIYGYSNFDNYGLAGQIGKAVLDLGLGIDEKGNMGMDDFAINIASIAFGLGAGGLIVKGGKGLVKAILKNIPKSMLKRATPMVNKFVSQIGKFTGKIPNGGLNKINLKDNIVDVAKILTGDFTPVLKTVNTYSKTLNTSIKSFTKAYRSADSILNLAKGDLKGGLKLLNTNISSMSKLVKNKEFKTYLEGLSKISTSKADINAIIKAINEGPSNIEKAYKAMTDNPSKNNIQNARNTIKKYTDLMKKLEKLKA